MYPLYVRITDKEDIFMSKLSYYLVGLKENKDYVIPDDYRAIFIVYYSNFKKETYYIASGGWGILKKKKLYKVNYPLIASIYSFLPDDYFTDAYKKYPEIYK
jgi:hypothetical protein